MVLITKAAYTLFAIFADEKYIYKRAAHIVESERVFPLIILLFSAIYSDDV